jgi:hypothetical protein
MGRRYCVDVRQTSAQKVFVASKNLVTYLQPETSHGMNFHYNAAGYFQVVIDFLNDNGC